MRLTTPELYIEEKEGFSDENDIFNRKGFGERLYNLIVNSNENLVLALDAEWGQGKSTFIRMWCSHNHFHQNPPLKTIYFDAFENDYQKEPFLALAAEIYELLDNEDRKKEFKDKASKVLKAFGRGLLKTGIKVGTAGLLDGTQLDDIKGDVSELVSAQADAVIASKFESSKADKLALKEFKTFLSTIAQDEVEGERIVFVVDELDRCRPDFALELIESIKHLFSVPGVTFLLAMNRSQLEESIKYRYGRGIDSVTYLQKFINVWLELPRNSGERQRDDGVTYFETCLGKMTGGETILNMDAVICLMNLVSHLKPSFRSIERILTYLALLENSRQRAYSENYQGYIAVVCFLKVINPKLLEVVVKGQSGAEELLLELQLQEIGEHLEPYHSDYSLEYLAKEIEFDLSDNNRKKQMVDDGIITGYIYGRYPSNIIKSLYEELKAIQPTF